MKWLKYEESDFYAIAIYNYKSDDPHHMELRVGDYLCIREHYPGWYRGFKYTQPCILKIFPTSHIKLLPNEIFPELWAEMYSWIPYIRDCYLLTESNDFDQITEAIQIAIAERRFDSNMEKSKMTETNKRGLIQKMEVTRKMLGLPIESRTEKGEKIDLRTVSVIDLYAQHQREYETNRKVSKQFDSTVDNWCIYLKLLRINLEKSQQIEETIDINISLYKLEDRNRITRISETYSHRVGIRMSECDLIRANAIVMKDIQVIPSQKMFLVFQFIRIGPMNLTKKKKNDDTPYRRPKGVSVLEITNSLTEIIETEKQIGIHLIQREEFLESVTEQLITDYRINKRDYRSVINIQLKTIKPEELSDRNIVLLGMNPYFPSPNRLQRNCLYLGLHHAEIDKEKKKSEPNLEVEISVRDYNGNKIIMPSIEWRSFDEYRSVIYYHNSRPRWCDVMCLPLFDRIDRFSSIPHIQFLIWHRSLNDRNKSPRGVAYLKLFPDDTNAILGNKDHDNFHTLTIYKMEMDKIKTAEYLKIYNEYGGDDIIPNNTLKGTKKKGITKDVLYVQTALCSTEYTFDKLLASVCYQQQEDDQTILHKLHNQEIVVKNIDVNEMKKFSTKILESSLDLIQQATDDSHLGRNILDLLGEMFKAIKNLPECENQMENFIQETMHFNVHKQILRELINHKPENDSNILRAADWFIKIVVKSFQNYESEMLGNIDETALFNELVEHYLHILEELAKGKERPILRGLVLRKAGLIINALIPVCQPIGMAKLVNNLLTSCSDLEANSKSELTMNCMNSKLFVDSQCRKIILPETTKNILELFHFQLNKIYNEKERDQDQLLDNICNEMIEFIQLHERSWQKATPEIVNNLVYELIIEHNMLRTCVSIVSAGMDYLSKADSNGKLLHRPLMVLVSVIITFLSYISDKLWERIVKNQKDECPFCDAERMTDNYDMVLELFKLICELQNNPVYPSFKINGKNSPRLSSNNLGNSLSQTLQVTPRASKLMKQVWINMLFVQSRQFLSTLKQIHSIILKPYYLTGLSQNVRTMQSRLCCCHPTEKMQFDMIISAVECISSIITQPFLNLEKLPASAALRMMQSATEWDGDIRLGGAIQIKNIWHDLDILKNRFSMTFFNIFAKLTTIQNFKIRVLAVECLFDIVHLDRENKKTELITQIDQAMESAYSNYCEEMTKAFKQVLSSNSKYAVDSHLVENIIVQMNNIEECSYHLNDNSPINGMIVINNLRKFYKEMGRSDIIGRYLFKLMKIHEKIKNYSEMGNTLLELSSFYQWSSDIVQHTFLPPDYADCEFEYQLKAKLLEESLKYFEKEDWEQGIEVCKELIKGYTEHFIDFVKLSAVHSKMSELLKKIMIEDRTDPSMYIIFYLGNGFPKFITELPEKCIVIRNKRNVSEMSIDLNSQFKYTTVERKYPDSNDFACTDKKIFYMHVKPYKFRIPPKYENKFIKQRILKYYEHYEINEFAYKRLINSTEEDPCKRKIECWVILCDEKLPNILSVVPVNNLRKIECIDPFLEALSDIEAQIRKDEMLYQDYESSNSEKKHFFNQKMKDAIIKYVSPVAGGVTKLVEMIPMDSENLSYIADVITQVLSLIYQYLQAFEIYGNLENYMIFVSEFDKLCEVVSSKLDLVSDEYNTKILPDLYTKSTQKEANVTTTIRRPSIAIKIRHDDDVSSRKFKNTLDARAEIVSERWSINPNDVPLSACDSRESIFSIRSTIPTENRTASPAPPPIPPKPNRNASTIEPQLPPKPRCDSNLSLFN